VNKFQAALMIGAALTALISINDRRALLWILVGVADFVLTTGYQRSGLTTPPYPWVAGLADGCVCLALILSWKYRWEKYLFLIFQLSVLVSLLRIVGLIDTNYAYVTALEICNWLALLLIGGTHLLERVDVGTYPLRGIHRIVGALYALRRHE
jgi:hypothetical protein